jgi:hypothetical protein
MADLKSITLKNVELKWACLAEPQTRGEYASNKYQVDVVFGKDDAKLIKELKNARQAIKDLGEGLYSITLKSNRRPQVVDAKKRPLSIDELKAIGNGTKAIVKASQYKGFKDAIFLGLNAVMITSLQEYAGADAFADIDVESDDAPFDTSDDDDII